MPTAAARRKLKEHVVNLIEDEEEEGEAEDEESEEDVDEDEGEDEEDEDECDHDGERVDETGCAAAGAAAARVGGGEGDDDDSDSDSDSGSEDERPLSSRLAAAALRDPPKPAAVGRVGGSSAGAGGSGQRNSAVPKTASPRRIDGTMAKPKKRQREEAATGEEIAEDDNGDDDEPEEEEYEVEKIVAQREAKNGLEYYVKWLGWPESENTWEPEDHVIDCKMVMRVWRRQQQKQEGKQQKAKQEQMQQAQQWVKLTSCAVPKGARTEVGRMSHGDESDGEGSDDDFSAAALSESDSASESEQAAKPTGNALVSQRVRVCWLGDGDNVWYAGKVTSFSRTRGHVVVYDDGDRKTHLLDDSAEEIWTLERTTSRHKARQRQATTHERRTEAPVPQPPKPLPKPLPKPPPQTAVQAATRGVT